MHLYDNYGFTAAMYARALRRLDILKLLLNTHIQSLGQTITDLEHLTEQEKKLLFSFVNQQHPDNKRSLLHFSVLREGNDLGFFKPITNLSTVLNILKSVAIDGRRDSKANRNVINIKEDIFYYILISERDKNGIAQTKKTGLPPHISAMYEIKSNQYSLILTNLYYVSGEQRTNGLLASKHNAFAALCKSTIDPIERTQKTVNLLNSFSGISMSTDILSHSKEIVGFLLTLGADPQLTYNFNEKSFTPAQYISIVINNNNQATPSDINYLSEISTALQQASLSQQEVKIMTPGVSLAK